jgi:hypothetical protein
MSGEGKEVSDKYEFIGEYKNNRKKYGILKTS